MIDLTNGSKRVQVTQIWPFLNFLNPYPTRFIFRSPELESNFFWVAWVDLNSTQIFIFKESPRKNTKEKEKNLGWLEFDLKLIPIFDMNRIYTQPKNKFWSVDLTRICPSDMFVTQSEFMRSKPDLEINSGWPGWHKFDPNPNYLNPFLKF